MDKLIITGGVGFIGSHVIEEFIDDYQVTVIDNYTTGSNNNLPPKLVGHKNLTIINDDISSNSIESLFKGVKYVIHLAALASIEDSISNPELCHQSNTTGTFNIFYLSHKYNISRVVYASSAAICHEDKSEFIIDSPYEASKYINEIYGKMFYRVYNLETVGLRFFNVYGPRQNPFSQYGSVIPCFILNLINNKSVSICGSGEQCRDFVYVKDIVNAIKLSLISGKSSLGNSYEIGTGHGVSINYLASTLKDLLDSKLPNKSIPLRPGDTMEFVVADTEPAFNDLKFLADSSKFSLNLISCINYYRSNTDQYSVY